jgi:hypothetical protein
MTLFDAWPLLRDDNRWASQLPAPLPRTGFITPEAHMDGDVLMFAQVMTVIVMSCGGFVLVGLGARVLWRWGSRNRPASFDRGEREDLHRLETAVDAIAIEVERISEAQRFMVGLLSESAALRRPERGELASPIRTARNDTPH